MEIPFPNVSTLLYDHSFFNVLQYTVANILATREPNRLRFCLIETSMGVTPVSGPEPGSRSRALFLNPSILDWSGNQDHLNS